MFASTSASVYGSLRSGESLAEAERELALDVAEVDEERSGKDGRAPEDGVEVDPPRRRAGQAFRAPDLLARRADLPAGGRPAETVVQLQDDLDDRGPVARHQPLRDHGRPALLAPGRDQLHDLVELVGV